MSEWREPWQLDGEKILDHTGNVVVHLENSHPDTLAMARHIIACVNAASGISTELLEANGSLLISCREMLQPTTDKLVTDKINLAKMAMARDAVLAYADCDVYSLEDRGESLLEAAIVEARIAIHAYREST